MVSIIIPVYNVENYIERCLDSVISQTFSEGIECILVDDCGPDSSIKKAKEFINQYSGPIEFKIIGHSENRGLAAARNTGIDNANREWIMHLDSDDWLNPNALELLIKEQKKTNADIVSGNAIAHYDTHDSLLEEPDYSDNIEMVKNTIKLTLDHVIWRRIIRKSLYTDYNIRAIEGINIGEDHHTLPRLAFYAKSISKINSIVYHYNCKNASSYMNSNKGISLVKFQSDIRSLRILYDFFSNKNLEIMELIASEKKSYNKYMKNNAIILADAQSYKSLCQDSKFYTPYFFERIKYLLRLQGHKAKKNIKSIKVKSFTKSF